MTATIAEQISLPGVYDIPAEVYHADPVAGGSLSSSWARKLLPPHCPARFRYERDNPTVTTKTFEHGHAAHALVLGTGPKLVRIDADEWRTDATKDEVAAVRAEGAVPLKPADWDRVHAMADAIRRHPMAAAIFSPDRGKAEQALIWQDRETGIMLRALVDHLPWGSQGRTIVADYKTCASADPEKLQRSMHDFGYHQQADWYLSGVRALGLGGIVAPTFLFVFQEKTPPYLVYVAQPSSLTLLIGRDLNRQAIDLYARCVAEDRWPGYSDVVEVLGLPPYIENRYKEIA